MTTETVCELQQRQADEVEDLDELSKTGWVAFFLPDTELDAGDTLIVDGERYEVDGEPWAARNPRTRVVSHIEVSLERVAGADDDEEAGS